METLLVGVIGAVLAGLILYYIFGVGKQKNQRQKDNSKKERVGILNEGKDNQFIDNTIVGFDVGMKDKGKGTKAKRNKIS